MSYKSELDKIYDQEQTNFAQDLEKMFVPFLKALGFSLTDTENEKEIGDIFPDFSCRLYFADKEEQEITIIWNIPVGSHGKPDMSVSFNAGEEETYYSYNSPKPEDLVAAIKKAQEEIKLTCPDPESVNSQLSTAFSVKPFKDLKKKVLILRSSVQKDWLTKLNPIVKKFGFSNGKGTIDDEDQLSLAFDRKKDDATVSVTINLALEQTCDVYYYFDNLNFSNEVEDKCKIEDLLTFLPTFIQKAESERYMDGFKPGNNEEKGFKVLEVGSIDKKVGYKPDSKTYKFPYAMWIEGGARFVLSVGGTDSGDYTHFYIVLDGGDKTLTYKNGYADAKQRPLTISPPGYLGDKTFKPVLDLDKVLKDWNFYWDKIKSSGGFKNAKLKGWSFPGYRRAATTQFTRYLAGMTDTAIVFKESFARAQQVIQKITEALS